jgi:uncharacterized membrane protein
MSTVDGLPAHVLLVHFVVVLAPLCAVLLIVCGVWPAARRRLVWLVAAMAVAVAVLTPLTVEAGEWLQSRLGAPSDVQAHARLGATMIYVAAGLVAGAVLIVALHVSDRRARPPGLALTVAVGVVAVAVGVAGIVQVYRIGESGTRAAWADQISAVSPSAGP